MNENIETTANETVTNENTNNGGNIMKENNNITKEEKLQGLKDSVKKVGVAFGSFTINVAAATIGAIGGMIIYDKFINKQPVPAPTTETEENK